MLSRLPGVVPLLEPAKCPTLYGLAQFASEMAAAGASGAGKAGAGGGGVPGMHDSPAASEDDGWAEVPVSAAHGFGDPEYGLSWKSKAYRA